MSCGGESSYEEHDDDSDILTEEVDDTHSEEETSNTTNSDSNIKNRIMEEWDRADGDGYEYFAFGLDNSFTLTYNAGTVDEISFNYNVVVRGC